LTEGEEMKIRSRITKLIAITMAVAAMAVIGSSWAAGRAGAAGRSDRNDIYVSRSLVGIIPGQGLRISVGSAANSIGDQAQFTFTVTNSGGVPLYESEWRYVPVRGFHCSHVSRRDLNTDGEPGTLRAQVMVTVTLRVPAGSNPEDYIGSLEVVDDRTGGTIVMSNDKFTWLTHIDRTV
jgi:hypothetical protein